eukprot:12739915-Alexandrium_andersonii.AAC.1
MNDATLRQFSNSRPRGTVFLSPTLAPTVLFNVPGSQTRTPGQAQDRRSTSRPVSASTVRTPLVQTKHPPTSCNDHPS